MSRNNTYNRTPSLPCEWCEDFPETFTLRHSWHMNPGLVMGRRVWKRHRRFPDHGCKSFLNPPPAWIQAHWNRLIRRQQDRALAKMIDDYDNTVMPPANILYKKCEWSWY